jgi:hypothetical protein
VAGRLKGGNMNNKYDFQGANALMDGLLEVIKAKMSKVVLCVMFSLEHERFPRFYAGIN